MGSFRACPGARELFADMNEASHLVGLYEATWIKQDLGSLFTTLNVVQDPSPSRSSIKTPPNPMKLAWSNMFVKVSAIFLRREYHAVLRDIIKYAVVGDDRPDLESDREMAIDGNEEDDSVAPFHNYIADVNVEHPPSSQGAIVSGSPGIGKTLFLYYALALCLLARRPAVFQDHSQKLFVMNDEGIF